jgi:hypothetical protein
MNRPNLTTLGASVSLVLCSLKQPAIEKENACQLSCDGVRFQVFVEFSDVLDIGILKARTEHERDAHTSLGIYIRIIVFKKQQ